MTRSGDSDDPNKTADPDAVVDPHATIPPSAPPDANSGGFDTVAPDRSSSDEASSFESAAPSNRYRIIQKHAEGGLGIVSLAMDEELNREVALKELKPRLADNRTSRQRFLVEAEVTGCLEHPGIVPVYGLSRSIDGRPYYAMRFIRGNSLADAIDHFHKTVDQKDRMLELRKLLRRFIDVCNAISYAHSRGVVHRDLKPANIMLGPYGETLVVDWGLAAIVGEPEPAKGESTEASGEGSSSGLRLTVRNLNNSPATMQGSTIGTPPYMSPEQARGENNKIGPLSDVYGLGATLYCLITGRSPIAAEDFSSRSDLEGRGRAVDIEATRPNREDDTETTFTLADVLDRAARGIFPRPTRLASWLPKPLEAITLRAMAHTPSDRYANAKLLAEDIERWLADETVAAYRESPSERMLRWTRRHKAWTQAIVATLVIISVVSVLATLMVNDARHRERQQFLASTLLRDIQDSLTGSEWPENWLSELETKLEQYKSLPDRKDVQAWEDNIQDEFARRLSAALAQPRITEDELTSLARRIDQLRPYRPALASEFDERLARRKRLWQTLVRTEPGRATDATAALFTSGRARPSADGNLVSVPLPENEWTDETFPHFVLCEQASEGNCEITARWNAAWVSAPAVGLLLNYQDGARYEFVVSVPHYDSRILRNLTDDWEYSQTMDTVRAGRILLKVAILRNGTPLRQTEAALPDGPLTMTARRIDDSLRFEVGGTLVLEAEDLFPLGFDGAGKFGLLWPTGVALEQLQLRQQNLSAEPSALERGDRLYSEGRFSEALAFYQGVSASATGAAADESLYKQALCLLESQRPAEAVEQLTPLADALGATTDDRQLWALRSAVRLWLFYISEAARLGTDNYEPARAAADRADRLLERLSPKYSIDDLAPLVPADVRERFFDYYRFPGTPDRLIFNPEGDLERLQQAARVMELFGESPQRRQMIRWKLAFAHRVRKQSQRAREILAELLQIENTDSVTRRAWQRDYLWLMLTDDQVTPALEQVNTWLATDGDPALLVERARIQMRLGQDAKAKVDLEAFFAQTEPSDLPHVEHGLACVLYGILLERGGQLDEAANYYRLARRKNTPARLETVIRGYELSEVEGFNFIESVTIDGIAASRSGEVTEADAQQMMRLLMQGTGVRGTALRRIAERGLEPDLLREVYLRFHRGEDGEAYCMDGLMRRIAFEDTAGGFLRRGLELGVTIGALADEPTPPEFIDLLHKNVDELIRLYNDGILAIDDIANLLTIWRGKSGGAEWAGLREKLTEPLRSHAAFVFGRRFLVMNDLERAKELLEEARDGLPEYDVVRKMSEASLERIMNSQPAF